ncbi:MAG: sensor domain-containing diguanylate cyclase [Candidatus Sedimenticola sp. (ex Thyasira tokunagai)]
MVTSPKIIAYLLTFAAVNSMVWWGIHEHRQQRIEEELNAFTTIEMITARGAAHAARIWIEHRITTLGPEARQQAEDEVLKNTILPLKLYPETNVWLFHNGALRYGRDAPFSENNRGKSIKQILSSLSPRGAGHLDELIEGVTLGSESGGWYIPGSGRQPEHAAWSSIKIGANIWTIGLSTPEQAILAAAGTKWQDQRDLLLGSIVTLVSFTLLLLAIYSHRKLLRRLRMLLSEIDDRAVVEKDLRENEDRYRKLFTGSKAIQLILDAKNGQIVDANDAACEYYGYHREDMKLMKIAAVNTLSPAEVEEEQRRAKEEGRAYCLLKHQLATGLIRDVEIYSNPIRLKSRSLVYAIIHDVTERKVMEEQIKHLGNHDVLTDLPNRALLLDRLEVAIEKAKRYSQHIAVLFIDLDGFKAINDDLGHRMGDKLLQQISVKLQLTVRKADTVARFGGDEFVLVLTEAGSRKDIARVTNKIQATIKKPFAIDGAQLLVGCSIGIAIYPQHGTTPDQLIIESDQAMYKAKKRGGNSIHFAPDPETGKA